jgi:molecular chaperone GrpE
MGVTPIAAVGEAFDPHFHEAVATEASDRFPPHTVTGELLRGYRVGDRVIRAAMVKVASAAPSWSTKNFASRENDPASSAGDILETES